MSDWFEQGNNAGQQCFTAALDYLGRGWAPLPLCPPDHVGVGRSHGKQCTSPGKVPVVAWKGYQTVRPTEQEVRSWFHAWPNANVGVALGPVSGLVGVDVDGERGEARLTEMSGGEVPATLEFSTGKGRRLLYSIPPGVTLVSTFDALAVSEELRLLGQGSQTVAPPSRHRTGSVYRWAVGKAPGNIAPAVAPAWLVAAMSVSRIVDGKPVDPLSDGELIPEGRRNSILTSMAGTMRRRGFSAEAIRAALAVENEGRCEPPLPEPDIVVIAQSVARYDPDAFAGVTITLSDGKATALTEKFPEAVPASALRLIREERRWLWDGYLARGFSTLLSALWKAGKTTLLAHLLKALEEGGEFCGKPCKPCKVLVVTEEHESLWATRRDKLSLSDNAWFMVRPFPIRPDPRRWQEFVGHLRDFRARWPYDLLVIDPISNLWPVKDENDAASVQNALLPLNTVGDDVALLLFHHLRKSDGTEATGSRGSGAITAFCDTLLELRRYDAGSKQDARRVLTGIGRFEETPLEVVLEWTGDGYLCHGERASVSTGELFDQILSVLEFREPGMTREQVGIMLKETKSVVVGLHKLGSALHTGADEGRWAQSGEGRRGCPFRYYRIPPADARPPENGPSSIPFPVSPLEAPESN